MSNHPNRGPKGPTSNPAPEEVAVARAAAGLTQRQAADLVHGTEAAWRAWESGLRRMPPGLWELFNIKTNQGADMLKTDNAKVLNDQLLAHLADGIKASRQVLSQDRSEAEKQYFTGGLDALDLLARKISESGVVNRAEFLEAVGCTV